MIRLEVGLKDNFEEFKERCCPCCGEQKSHTLFDLKASEICASNWSYSSNYQKILKLEPESCFPIVRCLPCGFIYAGLLPSEEFLRLLYDEVIDVPLAEEGSKDSGDFARRLRYVAQLPLLVPNRKTIKLLDFGSGYGITSKMLRLIDIDVYAFDPSQSRTSIVKESDVQIIRDLDEISQHAPFDIVVCDNVLEHVANIQEIVELFSKIIVPNGFLYVSVPSYENSFVEKLLMDQANDCLSEMSLNPWEHLNYFDLLHLDRSMADFGFIPLKQSELPEAVDIGLRPELSSIKRWQNGLMSLKRLFLYIINGSAINTVNSRFYRLIA